MKTIILAAGLALACIAPLPAAAHSDIAIRVDLGWPAAVYYRDGYRPARHVPYDHGYHHRPVVIYRDAGHLHGRGHHRDRGRDHDRDSGHGRHHHDRHCRH